MRPRCRIVVPGLLLGFICLLLGTTAPSFAFCPSAQRFFKTLPFNAEADEAEEAEAVQLDPETELALRIALEKVEHLKKSESSSPLLNRFFRQCAQNCQTAPSTIANAGTGLMAKRTIKQGTILSLYPIHCLGLDFGDYSPLVYDEEDAQYFEQEQDGSQAYVLNIIGSRPLPLLPSFVDASGLFLDVNIQQEDQPSWLSHYINDGATVESNSEAGVLSYYQQSAKARNCVHVPFGPCPLMATVATKKIKKGQELFTSYGCMYWLEQMLSEEEQEECTEITEAIQQEAQDSAKALFQAMKGIEVTQQTAAAAIQEEFNEQ